MSSYDLLTPSAGVVTFRKSVYDDDADTLTEDAVEVIQTNLTVHDPPTTPAWLSYTTSTEETNEGPRGSRTYLHFDFTIDTTDLADNDLHFIQIRASDGPNEVKQVFRFMKGNLQLNSISGCIAWVNPLLEDPRPAHNADLEPTNFGTGADFTTADTSDVYKRNVAMEADGLSINDGIVHSGALLSTSNEAQPYSIVLVCQPVRNPKLFMQTTSGNRFIFRWRNGFLEYERETSLQSKFVDAVSGVSDAEFGLFEYHKRPDGTIYIFENGALKITESDAESFGLANFVFCVMDFSFRQLFMQAAVFEFDLTNSQVEAIRKRLWQEYPDIDMQQLTPTQFT